MRKVECDFRIVTPGRLGASMGPEAATASATLLFPMCYGPEFAGRPLGQWAYLNGVEIDFSRPGKPTDNAHIEAFNSRLRAECLDASWFLSIADARDRLEAWRREYNEERSHGSLPNL